MRIYDENPRCTEVRVRWGEQRWGAGEVWSADVLMEWCGSGVRWSSGGGVALQHSPAMNQAVVVESEDVDELGMNC